jgi:hypothetical protein
MLRIRLACSPALILPPSFDVEMPLEVDDEYWIANDPRMAFQQPPGKPSVVTAFIFFIKICQMMSFTLRTIVSANFLGSQSFPTRVSIASIRPRSCSVSSVQRGESR